LVNVAREAGNGQRDRAIGRRDRRDCVAFYLAVQIRQNTRSQRSIVVDSLTQSLINLLGPQSSDPDLTRAFASATEDWYGAAEADRLRAVAVLFTLFKLFENVWFQKRQGTLDAQQWEGWDAYARMYFHLPGV